jgi:hypothetical protein
MILNPNEVDIRRGFIMVRKANAVRIEYTLLMGDYGTSRFYYCHITQFRLGDFEKHGMELA